MLVSFTFENEGVGGSGKKREFLVAHSFQLLPTFTFSVVGGG